MSGITDVMLVRKVKKLEKNSTCSRCSLDAEGELLAISEPWLDFPAQPQEFCLAKEQLNLFCEE